MPLPPKPKDTPADLAEVERAVSVLQGRHPEHERARREDEEARARRAARIDRAATAESNAERSRYVRLGAIAFPLVLLVGFLGMLGRREWLRRANVDRVTEPLRALGFTTVERSSPSATGRLEATVEPGCVVAISTEVAPIEITRAGTKTEGAGPRLFCTCVSERIGLSSVVPSGGGLALMRIDAASIGGSRAFPFAPLEPGSTLGGDDACSEASLDAWIDAKRYPSASTDGTWLGASADRAPLAAAGFRQAAKAEPSAPFVVVEVPKDSCLVATSSVPSDRLGLRLTGGKRPIAGAPGAFARCAQAERTVVVSHDGTGELVVLIAPARGVGGMQGVVELTRESGITLGKRNIPAADLAWDAKLILLASQIPEQTITTAAAPDVPDDNDARVAAVSFETPNALTPETPSETFSYCEPPLDAAMREATCVFSGPQKWRTEGGAQNVGGVARAKLPFWLFAMRKANDPTALAGMTELLTLARRLGRQGFTPTTLEALTELPAGVEVLGRTGEDAVVVVGVAPSPPWVYPLTDGPDWALDGEPRIVPVAPLERVILKASIRRLPPKASRSTVVFRRQKR